MLSERFVEGLDWMFEKYVGRNEIWRGDPYLYHLNIDNRIAGNNEFLDFYEVLWLHNSPAQKFVKKEYSKTDRKKYNKAMTIATFNPMTFRYLFSQREWDDLELDQISRLLLRKTKLWLYDFKYTPESPELHRLYELVQIVKSLGAPMDKWIKDFQQFREQHIELDVQRGVFEKFLDILTTPKTKFAGKSASARAISDFLEITQGNVNAAARLLLRNE